MQPTELKLKRCIDLAPGSSVLPLEEYGIYLRKGECHVPEVWLEAK